jgi:hypothetical protein
VAPSLRDIMQSEVASEPQYPAPRSDPGSWAAKASSSALNSDFPNQVRVRGRVGVRVIKISTTISNSNPNPNPNQHAAPRSNPNPPISSSSDPRIPLASPAPTQSRAQNHTDLSEWGLKELSKIDGADQSKFLGVLDYCATLASPVEVRETFSDYLGSSSQVMVRVRVIVKA